MPEQDDRVDHVSNEWVDDEEFDQWDIRGFILCMALASAVALFLFTGFGIVDSIEGRVLGAATLLFCGARLAASVMRPVRDDSKRDD